MTALREQVVSDTLDKVKLVYIDRIATKWWNARRGPDEPATFTGHYWVNGRREGGPFKTRSAAIRDAYYEVVLGRRAPSVGSSIFRRTRIV